MHKSSLIFLCVSVFLFVSISCKKKTISPVDPYTFDSEVQSSLDISYASHAVSDLFVLTCILSSTKELFYNDHYFNPVPAGSGTVTSFFGDTASISFNNTECKDGKSRSGFARLNFYCLHGVNPTIHFYLGKDYESSLRLRNFKTGDWYISLADTAVPLQVQIPVAKTLKWEINGKIRMNHISDVSRNLLIDVSFVITPANQQAFYYYPSGSTPWNTVTIRHFGTITGTRGNEHFTYTINHNDPLVRDMSCSVAVPGKPSANDFHPFTSGSSEFIIGTRHPRTINHGVDGGCNNTGNVTFAEETYPLTFY